MQENASKETKLLIFFKYLQDINYAMEDNEQLVIWDELN
jgi:hypothetical protein